MKIKTASLKKYLPLLEKYDSNNLAMGGELVIDTNRGLVCKTDGYVYITARAPELVMPDGRVFSLPSVPFTNFFHHVADEEIELKVSTKDISLQGNKAKLKLPVKPASYPRIGWEKMDRMTDLDVYLPKEVIAEASALISGYELDNKYMPQFENITVSYEDTACFWAGSAHKMASYRSPVKSTEFEGCFMLPPDILSFLKDTKNAYEVHITQERTVVAFYSGDIMVVSPVLLDKAINWQKLVDDTTQQHIGMQFVPEQLINAVRIIMPLVQGDTRYVDIHIKQRQVRFTATNGENGGTTEAVVEPIAPFHEEIIPVEVRVDAAALIQLLARFKKEKVITMLFSREGRPPILYRNEAGDKSVFISVAKKS